MTSGTIIPWILGMLYTLSLIAAFAAVKFWREKKRSPYFFLRRQAEKNLQAYLSLSITLFILGLGTTAYAWRPVPDDTLRVAILTNSKPAKQDIVDLVQEAAAETAAIELNAALQLGEQGNLFSSGESVTLLGISETNLSEATPELPARYDKYEHVVELNENTALGTINFSQEISQDFEALEPKRIFFEGFYTLYATFSYEGMENGMTWAWVWRKNGDVVDGGNELWAYGDSGPGYIYFDPEEGFQSGEYTLEIWVNRELLDIGTIVMNSAGVKANN